MTNCSFCGTPIPSGSPACPNCGSHFDESLLQSPSTDTPSMSRTSMKVVSVLGFLTAAISLSLFIGMYPLSLFLSARLFSGYPALVGMHSLLVAGLLVGALAAIVNPRIGGICMFFAGLLATPVFDFAWPLIIALLGLGGTLAHYSPGKVKGQGTG